MLLQDVEYEVTGNTYRETNRINDCLQTRFPNILQLVSLLKDDTIILLRVSHVFSPGGIRLVNIA